MKSNSVVGDPPTHAIQSIGNHHTGPETPLQKDHGSMFSYFTAFITCLLCISHEKKKVELVSEIKTDPQ